jgi:hypothetical protein
MRHTHTATAVITILLLLVATFTSRGQAEYILNRVIPFSNAIFTTDKLGNAYVTTENQLLEFNSHGFPLFNYNAPDLGSLRLVDASNPLKLLLYYPDFYQINILDDKFSLQSTINLQNIGIMQPTVVCNSNHLGYWVYDLQDFQLKKIDLNLQIVNKSGDITQIIGADIVPNYLVEAGDYVYLNNPGTGILVFDLFGTYVKTIGLPKLKNFQIIGDQILYVEDNTLMSYHLKTALIKEIKLPPHDPIVSVQIEDKQLYLLTTTSLSFYSF